MCIAEEKEKEELHSQCMCLHHISINQELLSWRGLPVGPEKCWGQRWSLRWTVLPVAPPLTLRSPPPRKLPQRGALIPVGQT